jgi:hypothetical protein
MSQPGTTADPRAGRDSPSITSVFDVDDAAPYETQRTVQRYLSQETRHNIIQTLLGHPSHLASTTELSYYIPRSRSAISEQLDDLADHKLITRYHHEPNASSRDIPADFWGFTAFGVTLLADYKYLRGVPIMRAVHDATHKTETVKRHENAPRPELPEEVCDALEYDEPDVPTDAGNEESTLPDLREQTFYSDAAPEDPSVLNDDRDGDRTLDDLF